MIEDNTMNFTKEEINAINEIEVVGAIILEHWPIERDTLDIREHIFF